MVERWGWRNKDCGDSGGGGGAPLASPRVGPTLKLWWGYHHHHHHTVRSQPVGPTTPLWPPGGTGLTGVTSLGSHDIMSVTWLLCQSHWWHVTTSPRLSDFPRIFFPLKKKSNFFELNQNAIITILFFIPVIYIAIITYSWNSIFRKLILCFITWRIIWTIFLLIKHPLWLNGRYFLAKYLICKSNSPQNGKAHHKNKNLTNSIWILYLLCY